MISPVGLKVEFIKVYFERFPGIQTYLNETKERVREQRYVETLLGRRRTFPVFRQGAEYGFGFGGVGGDEGAEQGGVKGWSVGKDFQ